jgi:copper type II ascorbate-dependent monooxygenase-like protein
MMSTFRIPVVIVALLGAGCGGSAPAVFSLEPPPPGEGVQIKMTSTLEAGLETERCMFYRVPADGLYVNRQEIRYTPGSHHVLVFKTPYTEIPTVTLRGETIDTSGVFDCGANGATGDWEVQGVAGGAQSAAGPPGIEGLPADTALKIDGGSLLLVNAHYLNASDSALDAEIYINFYTIAPAQVTREAGIFFMYDPFIHVPAQSASVAREVCPVSKDVTLVNAQSHMHARGVGYVADLVDASGARLQQLYTTTTWQHVVSKRLDPPVQISAGQMIDFHCNYTNNETHMVSQGRTTRDEMCMFIGLYYPRDTKSEICSMTDDWSGRYLGASWIGNGTAAGLVTAACLQAATQMTAAMGDFDACVVNACPAISALTSTAARCLASKGLGQCATECAGSTGTNVTPECRACVVGICTPAMMTLAGAACS